MNQIILQKQETPSTPIHCQFCGGLMRLIGSEPHPIEDNLDLLTYLCSACDELRCRQSKPANHVDDRDSLTREGKAFRHRSVLSVLNRFVRWSFCSKGWRGVIVFPRCSKPRLSQRFLVFKRSSPREIIVPAEVPVDFSSVILEGLTEVGRKFSRMAVADYGLSSSRRFL